MNITISVNSEQFKRLKELGASAFVQKCLDLEKAGDGRLESFTEEERRDVVSALYLMAQNIGTEEQIARWAELARRLS